MAARLDVSRLHGIRRRIARQWRADGWPTRVIARALGVHVERAREYVQGVMVDRERMGRRGVEKPKGLRVEG